MSTTAGQEHGSRIITALEAAWAAIRARHPEVVPAVVIVTGARGSLAGIKDASAEGNRYHNKRFVALATELGLRGPARESRRLVRLPHHRRDRPGLPRRHPRD